MPLNGTKTHPLSDHARAVLRKLLDGPIPTSTINQSHPPEDHAGWHGRTVAHKSQRPEGIVMGECRRCQAASIVVALDGDRIRQQEFELSLLREALDNLRARVTPEVFQEATECIWTLPRGSEYEQSLGEILRDLVERWPDAVAEIKRRLGVLE